MSILIPCQPTETQILLFLEMGIHSYPNLSNHPHSESSSSSSSISSQSSLRSIPSLNPPSKDISPIDQLRISTLKGHSSNVFSLAFDGKHLYSGSSNGKICVWNQSSCSNHKSPTENIVSSCNSAVKSMLVFGDKLFSAHQDHKIRVWRIDNTTYQKYKCIATLPTLNDRVTRFFSAKNYVEIRRHKKCTWVHHVDTISALALSKDGSFIYSASWDRTFKVWRTSDFKCLESVWNAHDDAINAILLSNDELVYTGSADKKIKVWRRKGEKKHILVDVLEKHKSSVNALAVSTDGTVMYSGACDRSIIVWEKRSSDGNMAVAGALRGHTKAILCLSVVSDLLCSGSADKTVRIWRKEIGRTYACVAVLKGHGGPVKCLTAAGDSSCAANDSAIGVPFFVYSGSLDCDVKVWQIWVPLLANLGSS